MAPDPTPRPEPDPARRPVPDPTPRPEPDPARRPAPDPPLPLFVLAGCTPEEEPAAARASPSDTAGERARRELVGCKGARLRIGERPLVAHLVARMRASGSFGPIFIVGPEPIYGSLDVEASVLDVRGSLGATLRRGIEAAAREHPSAPIALVTCDVVPDPAEVRVVMDDYRSGPPPDIWSPLVRVPDEPERLGSFGWKPRYLLSEDPDGRPAPVLPGHLFILTPEAIRRAFLYRLFDAGYADRRLPVPQRATQMLVRLGWAITRHALWDAILLEAIPTVHRLAAGRAAVTDVARAVDRLLVRRGRRRRHPQRMTRLPLTDALSLARDVDTEEEARELGAELMRDGRASPSRNEWPSEV